MIVNRVYTKKGLINEISRLQGDGFTVEADLDLSPRNIAYNARKGDQTEGIEKRPWYQAIMDYTRGTIALIKLASSLDENW